MVQFQNISACPPASLPADPTDMKAMMKVLLQAEQCAVRGYTQICDVTMKRTDRAPAAGLRHESCRAPAWPL